MYDREPQFQLESQGSLVAALKLVERRRTQHGRDSLLLFDAARLHKRLGNAGRAAALAGELADREQGELRDAALVIVAHCHAEAHAYAQAAATLAAVEIPADRVDLYVMLGVWWRRAGEYQRAREALEAATRLEPLFDEAHLNLGVVLFFDLQDQEAGLAALRRAAALGRNWSANHRALGHALWCTALHDDTARVHLQRAVELQPEDGWSHLYLAYATPDRRAAEALYLAAINLLPLDAIPLSEYGAFLLQHGEAQRACAQLAEAARIDPACARTAELLADCARALGGP